LAEEGVNSLNRDQAQPTGRNFVQQFPDHRSDGRQLIAELMANGLVDFLASKLFAMLR
jgi:hypothetical protein